MSPILNIIRAIILSIRAKMSKSFMLFHSHVYYLYILDVFVYRIK